VSFGRFWSVDYLQNLLIYLPLRSHGLIPSFTPPIWCLKSTFSAQIADFRVAAFGSRIWVSSGTYGGTTASPPSGTTGSLSAVLPLGTKQHQQLHDFEHIFCIRTRILVFFSSFRRGGRALHHHPRCSCYLLQPNSVSKDGYTNNGWRLRRKV
jgi:hypothetical protein